MSDLLNELQNAETGEEREWLVMKFSLDSLEPAVREVVWTASVPQWFDREFLAALLKRDIDADFGRIFDKLISLSFVEPFHNRGYNIHERSRALLLNRFWQDDRGRYVELNSLAAKYSSERAESNREWRVASLYHKLLSDSPKSVNEFIQQATEWSNQFDYVMVEALIRPVITEWEAGRVSARAGAWAYSFQGELYYLHSQFQLSKKALELALDTWDSDLVLKAASLKSLGSIYFMLEQNDVARLKLEEGLKTFSQINSQIGQANCLYWIGEIHRLADELNEALLKQEEALELYRQAGSELGEANCLHTLGDIQRLQGEYEKGREHINAAGQLYARLGHQGGEANCVKSMADIYLGLDEYDHALNAYNKALELLRELNDRLGEANSLYGLGLLHVKLRQYEAARSFTEQARDLFAEIGEKFGENRCVEILKEIRDK